MKFLIIRPTFYGMSTKNAAGVLVHPYTYEIIPYDWLGKKSIFRYGDLSGTDILLKDALKDSGLPELGRTPPNQDGRQKGSN